MALIGGADDEGEGGARGGGAGRGVVPFIPLQLPHSHPSERIIIPGHTPLLSLILPPLPGGGGTS